MQCRYSSSTAIAPRLSDARQIIIPEAARDLSTPSILLVLKDRREVESTGQPSNVEAWNEMTVVSHRI